MIYSVINMDIVGSRKLQNRKDIQDLLRNYFKEVSIRFKHILATNVTITLGDEWQIVLKRPEESYNLISEINSFLITKNIKTYSGIGFGSISTDIYKTTSEMDGEAFINAREALNISKKKGDTINSRNNRVFFKAMPSYIYKEEEAFNEVALTSIDNNCLMGGSLNNLINTIIENTEILFSKITPKQLNVIKVYERFGSYSKVIENSSLNSKSDISQKLNSAEYFTFNNNKKYIKELFKLYLFNILRG